MIFFVLYFLCLLAPAITKPRYTDLDEDDLQLFRAVFDTPSYNHEEHEEEDLDLGKMDISKDGMWLIKAKLAELRAINKALVSNLLSTKLKLKDLLTNHLPAKKHHHEINEIKNAKRKPTHNMYSQPPAYHSHHQQHEPQHAMPQYDYDPYYGH